MANAAEMIMHCMIHQPPTIEERYCERCSTRLRVVDGGWKCPNCHKVVKTTCLICIERRKRNGSA